MFWFPEDSPLRGTVSDFHEWVWAKHDEKMQVRLFYRQHPEMIPLKFGGYEQLMKSRMAHAKMQHNKINLCKPVLNEWARETSEPTDWVIEYVGSHDVQTAEVLTASRQLVDKRPIRGCPDLVFRNSKTGQVLIVEIKITWVPFKFIEEDVYPNVRAQLWCYSWMDSWSQLVDENVLMGATFWDIDLKKFVRSKIWNRSDIHLNNECRDWFNEYGGQLIFEDSAG